MVVIFQCNAFIILNLYLSDAFMLKLKFYMLIFKGKCWEFNNVFNYDIYIIIFNYFN